MTSNEPEPPGSAPEFGHIDVWSSLKDVKKLWGAFREQGDLNSDQDDTSAAQTALCCSYFLSTWGEVFYKNFTVMGC